MKLTALTWPKNSKKRRKSVSENSFSEISENRIFVLADEIDSKLIRRKNKKNGLKLTADKRPKKSKYGRNEFKKLRKVGA